jgi:branched-chain amino acid transport system permease protein
MFVFTVLAIALSANFKNSAIGRACISIKEDEIASEAMGINTTKYKVTAFVFGALLASVAGALYATSYYVIKPETFGITNSINILVIVVFGGMGSLTGSVVAAIVLRCYKYCLTTIS